MKTLLKIFGFILLAGFILSSFGEDEPVQKASADAPWDGGGAKYVCQQAIKKAAVDPGSIEWIDRLSWPVVPGGTPDVFKTQVAWRGRNGFGGMVPSRTTCTVTRVGENLVLTGIE